jgi:hypothetical protein
MENRQMYHPTNFTSGHTIYSSHIERPLRPFEVQRNAPALRVHSNDGHSLGYAVVRWARVLVETEAGRSGSRSITAQGVMGLNCAA